MGGSPSGRGHLLAASALATIIVYLQKSGLGKHLPPRKDGSSGDPRWLLHLPSPANH